MKENFISVFKWIHEWGLKPSNDIYHAGQWKDGTGNYFTIEELFAYYQRDNQLLNSKKNPEVCDATTDDKSGEAGNKITLPVDQELLDEAVSDVTLICSLNDRETAKRLISKQFIVVSKEDWEANTKTPSIYPSPVELISKVLHWVRGNYEIDFAEGNHWHDCLDDEETPITDKELAQKYLDENPVEPQLRELFNQA